MAAARNVSAAALGLQLCGKLGNGGGFAHAVHPDHHDDQRSVAGIGGRATGGIEDAGDLRLQRIANRVRPAIIAHPGAHRFDDLHAGFDADVGSDQGFFQPLVDLVDLLAAGDSGTNARQEVFARLA